MKNFMKKDDQKKASRKSKSEVKDYFFRGMITSYVENIFRGNAF